MSSRCHPQPLLQFQRTDALASSQRSNSSVVVRITGNTLGWMGDRDGLRRQKAEQLVIPLKRALFGLRTRGTHRQPADLR